MTDSVSPDEHEKADEEPGPASGRRKSPTVALLSRQRLWICFALSMLVFLFVGGPIWKHPWHIDANAYWSYAVIPPLVIGCLLLEQNLTIVAAALGTMEITLYKFGATYVMSHAAWLLVLPPPEPPKIPVPVVTAAPPETAPIPTPIDPAATGTLETKVTDAAGNPVLHAFVLVEGGLEAFSFAAPEEPITLRDEGNAIEPVLTVVQTWQSMRARSGDRQLHTLVATVDDSDLFSIPLQSSGAWTTVRVGTTKGIASLRCGVHQHSLENARLVVTDNPFHGRTDERGVFRAPGIPAAHLRVLALSEDGQKSGAAAIAIDRGNTASLVISL